MRINIDLSDKLLAYLKKYFKGNTINEIAETALINYIEY